MSAMAEADLDLLARRAAQGDRAALQRLCRELQHPVYRLALRFFGTPEDAQDLTQEILVRVITNLGSFEGRSKFMTWVYAIATRQLLRSRKRQIESSVRGAEAFAQVLDQLRADRDYRDHAGRVPPAARAGAADDAPHHRAPLRARPRRESVPLQPPDRGEHPDGHPRAVAPAVRCAPTGRRPADRDGHARGAASQLDLAEGIAEIYRSDPQWPAPRQVWDVLRRACPDLIG